MDPQRLRAEGETTPRRQHAGVAFERTRALLAAMVLAIVFKGLVPVVAATLWGN
ncbi:MAG TPA: hypothetical protein VJ913_06555 [Actinomycetota bacterium]|nr:hypothetical protein [Actinomycetota bacterium]